MRRRLPVITLVLVLALALAGCGSHTSKEATYYRQEVGGGETVYLKSSHPTVKALLAQLEGYAQARYTIDYQSTNGQEEYDYYTTEFRQCG